MLAVEGTAFTKVPRQERDKFLSRSEIEERYEDKAQRCNQLCHGVQDRQDDRGIVKQETQSIRLLFLESYSLCPVRNRLKEDKNLEHG